MLDGSSGGLGQLLLLHLGQLLLVVLVWEWESGGSKGPHIS